MQKSDEFEVTQYLNKLWLVDYQAKMGYPLEADLRTKSSTQKINKFPDLDYINDLFEKKKGEL
jgi:hypothetical protein